MIVIIIFKSGSVIMKSNLGPMKYHVGDNVIFDFNGKILEGRIWNADFGGSLEMLGKCHSYDLESQIDGETVLLKHVPEASVFKILSAKDKQS